MTKLDHAFAEIAGSDVDPDADFSLPGWIYHDREFFDLEQERIFRPSWQIVCHVSEVAGPGDYRTLDYLGESVVGKLLPALDVLRREHVLLVQFQEIADMPLSTQARILRVLTDQSFVRVGGTRQIGVDVRVVSSTTRDLTVEMAEKRFREDLFYRLNVVPVTIPSLAQRREAQVAEIEKLVVQGEAMTERVAELGRVLAEIDRTSSAARESLGAGLGTLAQQLGEKRAVIAATEAQLLQLTDSSVRLLEILQSGARTCHEDLSTAINGANTALEGVEARADKVEALMLRSTQAGSELSDYLLRTRAEIDTAEIAIAGFKSHLAEETEDALARLQGLRGGFARLAEESGTLAAETQDSLRASLSALETAITRAFATLDEGAREKMLALANNLGGEAVEVLERALRNEAAATLGKLEQSAAHASGVGREAAIQLRDQLVKVNELTGNLEQRVMHARELAEEQVNNDFARRMALITDSLNSAAIDITGALADEVADTAWEAYLKGDRGIFTRRAVRLIDNSTAKDIAALYSADETFKANVSRYIHDFEAMLRQTLSTRDGHVLSVTMLGSDMGKLYVALAQAIQRFR